MLCYVMLCYVMLCYVMLCTAPERNCRSGNEKKFADFTWTFHVAVEFDLPGFLTSLVNPCCNMLNARIFHSQA